MFLYNESLQKKRVECWFGKGGINRLIPRLVAKKQELLTLINDKNVQYISKNVSYVSLKYSYFMFNLHFETGMPMKQWLDFNRSLFGTFIEGN